MFFHLILWLPLKSSAPFPSHVSSKYLTFILLLIRLIIKWQQQQNLVHGGRLVLEASFPFMSLNVVHLYLMLL